MRTEGTSVCGGRGDCVGDNKHRSARFRVFRGIATAQPVERPSSCRCSKPLHRNWCCSSRTVRYWGEGEGKEGNDKSTLGASQPATVELKSRSL